MPPLVAKRVAFPSRRLASSRALAPPSGLRQHAPRQGGHRCRSSPSEPPQVRVFAASAPSTGDGQALGYEVAVSRRGGAAPRCSRCRILGGTEGACGQTADRPPLTRPVLAAIPQGSTPPPEQPPGESQPSAQQQQQPSASTSAAVLPGGGGGGGGDPQQQQQRAPLRLPRDVIERLKTTVFGFDTFYVTGVDNYHKGEGVVFRGNMRAKDAAAAYERMKARMKASDGRCVAGAPRCRSG